MLSNSPVAIALVGIAAELPSGDWSKSNLDYSSFYDFLLQGGQAYESIPLDRFNVHKLKGTASGQLAADTGAFLKDIGLFDPVEFGVTNKDIRMMSVGTRKLIEATFLALLDSGIDYRGRDIGCYMSAVAHDMTSVSGHDDAEVRGSFSSGPAMVANRVSYHLDLRGPTIPLDTACSSTLHATHLAVQALRAGECEAAVVGGCQVNHRFAEWLTYTQGGVLSPDGKCKPFDATANGFGRGEATVSIVLKPLDAALRDRDRIYATILGTSINSSGSLAPVNAPVASAQQRAMLRAFAEARRSPRDVDFIELHATGTASGDPTEANWVGVQFKRDSELLVGSVKGNIGHTEITAFLASLCKVCHIIEYGVIPPTVNLTVPNPAIRWADHNMRVPVTPEKLSIRSSSGRALIAMSSSGIGGANGHCVIEAHAPNTDAVARLWSCDRSIIPLLLIAGGLSPRSASAVGESLKTILADRDRACIGRILGRRSRSMLWKAYSVSPDGQIPLFAEPVLTPKAAPEVVFVFSGQGPQHWNMGRELFRTCVPFHDTVVELDAIFTEVTGRSLTTDIGLFDDSGVPDSLGDIWPISITLPALTILQIALVDTLAAVGVKPDVVVGHSAGETAVLYASGAATKAMAVELSIARGQAMEVLEAHDGAMAAVACSAARAKELIAEVIAELGPAALEVGCYNAPNAVTLSGSTKHIVYAVGLAKASGILATQLRTRTPVHSSMVTLCQREYEQRVGEVFNKYAVGLTKVETFSTLTGDALRTPYDARYFWDNTLGPVMFDSAMKAIRSRHPQAIFVEIGPHPVLSGYITANLGQPATVLTPLKRARSSVAGELVPLMDFIGRLVCAGYSTVDMDVLYGTAISQGTVIPPYPLARKEVPYVAPTFEIARQRQARRGPLNYPQLRINVHTHPGLADHVIMNEPIMPAAGFLEMALEFGAKRLWDVQFHSILSLASERPTPIDVALDGPKWSVRSAAVAEFTRREEFLVEIRGAGNDLDNVSDYRLHPAILDAALHIAVHPTITGALSQGRYYLPSKLGTMIIHDALAQGIPEKLYAHGVFVKWTPEALTYNFTLTNEAGLPLCTIEGLEVAAHGKTPLLVQNRYEIVYQRLDIGLSGAFETSGDGTAFETDASIDASSQTGSSPLRVLHYHRGEELNHQQTIRYLDPSDKLSVCFVASAGRDGDAVLGFTRSLRKEHPSWRVYCIVFTSSWPIAQQEAAARYLCTIPLAEEEMLIEANGAVTVARVVPSIAPRRTTTFDPEAPWVYQGSTFSQVSKPTVPPNHVLVRIMGVSSNMSSCWAFVGYVDGSPSIYLGVTLSPLTNYVVAHRGSLLQLTGIQSLGHGPRVLAAIIAVLAVGPANYNDPQRLKDTCILVTHSDTTIGRSLCQLYEGRGFHIARLSSQASVSKIRAALSQRPKFIVSGREKTMDIDIDETVTRLQTGRVFQWDDPGTGMAHVLTNDPWTIGDALKLALLDIVHADSNEALIPPIRALNVVPPAEVPLQTTIFHPEKAYMLIGGIGGFGPHLARWMYENGARELILTSRSGTATLVPKNDYTALRLLAYLRSRKDLVLRTEAVDASSVEQTKDLVASIKKPLGGCMILTAVLIDRTFLTQTPDTFEAPFNAKVGAFDALERAIDIDTLDFMIAYSSVAGMLGNAGQTNYSSANTALTGLTRRYKKAATMIPPMILTGTFLTVSATDSVQWSRFRHLHAWAMTGEEVCERIGDMLLKLREGPLWQYIPDFDWNIVRKYNGPSPLFDHLAVQASSSETQSTRDTSMQNVTGNEDAYPEGRTLADKARDAGGDLDELRDVLLALGMAGTAQPSDAQSWVTLD
ncbi:hypothetical protein EVJ58_g8093 [Rhodofomes roseus]|uniref:Acyl transferase domain-containing protein n=1 Tax=Rhodofomes roseus TaxID=34475 RepID=A0A4Y9Y4H8_9APHY|nr:hypothetical protein EVJ58_g8093 [Rhodofomes roseus]